MSYQLELSSAAQREIKALPGNYRQRLRKVIRALSNEPRPSNSKLLDFRIKEGEARRIRVDNWRIVYAVIENSFEKRVAVVTVRRRPPYDYADLPLLFT